MTITVQDDEAKKGEPEIVVMSPPTTLTTTTSNTTNTAVTADGSTSSRRMMEPEHDVEIAVNRNANINMNMNMNSIPPFAAAASGSGSKMEMVFPAPFYCPITHQLMNDPVILPDGTSYERSAIVAAQGLESECECELEQEEEEQQQQVSEARVDDSADTTPTPTPPTTKTKTTSMLYPNRALKAIIDETTLLEKSGDSLYAGMKRFEHTMKSTYEQLLEKSAIPHYEHYQFPEAYHCPITFNLMHHPVVDPEGNSFEQVAIANWIRANGNSPITRTPLSLEQLYPNNAIQDLLDLEKNKPEELMHPSIAKWKEEAPPLASDPQVGGNMATLGSPGANSNSNLNSNGNNNNNTNYPTTFSELDRRRSARRRVVYKFVGILFALLCMVAFIMYGGIFMLMLFVLTLMIVFSRRENPQEGQG